MLQLDDSADGRSYGLRKGDRLSVRLRENPTTGFRWRLTQAGEAACRIVADEFEAAHEKVGQGGVHAWELEAVSSGGASLCFSLGRSWEPQAPARLVTVTLLIEE